MTFKSPLGLHKVKIQLKVRGIGKKTKRAPIKQSFKYLEFHQSYVVNIFINYNCWKMQYSFSQW